jgi:hypothetical protein
MGTGEKLAAGIVAIGMVTTLILPKRQTPAVINAAGGFARGVMGTAMGTAKAS